MDLSRFDLPRYLAALPLFQQMGPDELRALAGGCALHRLARGEMVFRVGQACEEFHVAVTGQVKLFATSPSGHEKVIAVIGPGNSFAEAMMFIGSPYIVNAQALSETLLMTVKKRVVMDGIARDPQFALRMLAGISRRLHGLVRDVEAYSLRSGVQRVIGYLLHEPAVAEAGQGEDNAGVTVSLPVSKAIIASRLSLTPEYFSRVLHELESADLIQIDKRDIRILDAQRLAAYQPTS